VTQVVDSLPKHEAEFNPSTVKVEMVPGIKESNNEVADISVLIICMFFPN
jgi:hypothetical protein